MPSTPPAGPESPAAAPPARHRVLLIDDQQLIGAAVRKLVAGEADIELLFCSDPETALDAALSFRPSVILQDLVMPGPDGREMVRRFRQFPPTSQVPVIMLSAREDATTKAQLLDSGANDYLVKLPDRVELVARIRVHSEAYHRLVERDQAFAALERSLADLARERERSERLLLSILPPAIAERLKNSQDTIAESFPSVTVLFADIAGFTEFSRHVDARLLVDLLDEIFSAFDRLAEAHGVEKIKTIGDAYMAVAGLPQPRPDHACVVARMALEMQSAFTEFVRGRGLPVALRIGIHSGPVVAGVIGRRKFAYDLWGTTVNVASRMESHGEPGQIHVSAAVRDLLGARFTLADRGEIVVKGTGAMHTFFLLGEA